MRKKKQRAFVTFDLRKDISSPPPGLDHPDFEIAFARAQTWLDAGLAGANRHVLTKMADNFDQLAIAILRWLIVELNAARIDIANDNQK